MLHVVGSLEAVHADKLRPQTRCFVSLHWKKSFDHCTGCVVVSFNCQGGTKLSNAQQLLMQTHWHVTHKTLGLQRVLLVQFGVHSLQIGALPSNSTSKDMHRTCKLFQHRLVENSSLAAAWENKDLLGCPCSIAWCISDLSDSIQAVKFRL